MAKKSAHTPSALAKRTSQFRLESVRPKRSSTTLTGSHLTVYGRSVARAGPPMKESSRTIRALPSVESRSHLARAIYSRNHESGRHRSRRFARLHSDAQIRPARSGGENRRGALHLYPEVYERGAFALDSLRAELQSAGVAIPLLEDKDLRRILDQVSVDTQFVVNVADIRKRRSRRGRKLPLINKSTEN